MFVPDENLLGEENAGFYLIMANFQWERLLMALGAVGAMQVAFEQTLEYALERRRSAAIGPRRSATSWPRSRSTVEAGRDVTYSALRRYVARRGRGPRGDDRQAGHPARGVRRDGHVPADPGRRGYMVEYGIERAARDARLGPIGGGTDEIMKEILGRSFGL